MTRPDPDSIIRVDHAGEYGAVRIYAGQLAVMGQRSALSPDIERMATQEQRHLERFEQLMVERRVRPTLLMPLWKRAGFALGAVSALIGPKAAMAVTAAIETEIDRHYQAQRHALGDSDPELSQTIADFQQEEQEHRELAIDRGAKEALSWPLLSVMVRAGCRAAIRLSERV